MLLALEEAKKSLTATRSEVPVGSIIIHNTTKEILGKGRNLVIQNNDCTAHAEIIAIRNASGFIKNYRLDNTSIYTTLEPCPLCLSAIINARITCIYFGAASMDETSYPKLPKNLKIFGGIMEEECKNLLQNFFQEKRDLCKR